MAIAEPENLSETAPIGGAGRAEDVKARTTDRPRLQIDFTPDAFKHLEKMRELAKVKTPAEVAKNALRLYDWYLQKQDEGYTLLIEKEDVVRQVEVLL
jgi:hypothetical protein